MKKWLMVLLMGLFLFGVVGCKDDEPADDDDPNDEIELDQELPAEFAGFAEGDIYITTIGQSADLDTVWNLLSNVYDNDNDALEAAIEKDVLLEAFEGHGCRRHQSGTGRKPGRCFYCTSRSG